MLSLTPDDARLKITFHKLHCSFWEIARISCAIPIALLLLSKVSLCSETMWFRTPRWKIKSLAELRMVGLANAWHARKSKFKIKIIFAP